MKNSKKIENKQFNILLVYAGFAYMILDQNLLTLILQEKFNYSISYISFLELILQFSTIFLEIPTGIIGDFISRKILLICARLSYIVYGTIFLISTDYKALMFAFVLLGISESLISGTEESVVANVKIDSSMKKYMYFSTVVQIATVVSILLGGLLYNNNWKYIYIIIIIFQSISLLLIVFFKIKPTKNRKKGKMHIYIKTLKDMFFNFGLIKIILSGACLGGIYSVYIIYSPLFLASRNLTAVNISIIFIIQIIAGSIITFILGKNAETIKAKDVCISTIIFFCLGILFHFSNSNILNVLGTLICCISGYVYFPSITSILNDLIPDEIRTTGNSIINMTQTGFMCIFIFIIGIFF